MQYPGHSGPAVRVQAVRTSVSSTPHTLERDSARHAVVAAAAGPVVRSGPLHSHYLSLWLVVRTHLCAAAFENLNVPTRAEVHCWNRKIQTGEYRALLRAQEIINPKNCSTE